MTLSDFEQRYAIIYTHPVKDDHSFKKKYGTMIKSKKKDQRMYQQEQLHVSSDVYLSISRYDQTLK